MEEKEEAENNFWHARTAERGISDREILKRRDELNAEIESLNRTLKGAKGNRKKALADTLDRKIKEALEIRERFVSSCHNLMSSTVRMGLGAYPALEANDIISIAGEKMIACYHHFNSNSKVKFSSYYCEAVKNGLKSELKVSKRRGRMYRSLERFDEFPYVDPSENGQSRLERAFYVGTVRSALGCLPIRDAEIARRCYGIGRNSATLRKTARKFGLTAQGVLIIRRRAERRLAGFLADAYENASSDDLERVVARAKLN